MRSDVVFLCNRTNLVDLLFDRGSGVSADAVLSVLHRGNDRITTLSSLDEGESSLYLRKHGSALELTLADVFLSLSDSHALDRLCIRGAVVEHDVVNGGDEHQYIGVDFLCEKSTCQIFLDDSTCAL